MHDWQEAEHRIERAQRLCEMRHWAEALVELDAALAIQPDNAAWHAQRGVLLEELGRSEEAAGAFERSLDIDGSDPDVVMALATTLVSLNRLARALGLLEELSKQVPDYHPAVCQRIKVLAQLGKHEAAEETFYLAQQTVDDCPDCFFYLAESLAARENDERAMYCVERTLELEPHYYGASRRMAELHRKAGRLADAREALLDELRLEPGDTDILCELGGAALLMNDLPAAAAKFEYVLELEPDHSQAHAALGTIYLKLGRFEESVKFLVSARNLDTSDDQQSNIEFQLAVGYCKLGRFADARRELGSLLERHPDHGTALKLLARCLLAMDRASDAGDVLRRRLSSSDQDPEARLLLGLGFIRLGKTERALEEFEKVVSLEPDSGQNICTMAAGLLSVHEIGKARSLLTSARRKGCKQPEVIELQKHLRFFRFRRLWSRVSQIFQFGSKSQ